MQKSSKEAVTSYTHQLLMFAFENLKKKTFYISSNIQNIFYIHFQ